MAHLPRTGSMLATLAAVVLLAPLLGCGADGELSPLVSRDVFTVQFEELTAENDCDPAAYAPGDFYLSAELVDASLRHRDPGYDHAGYVYEYSLGEVRDRLVQTNAGTIAVGFGAEGEMLPPREGDRVLVEMSFYEKDSDVYVTAGRTLELLYGRDAETNERCWLLFDGRPNSRCFDASSDVRDQRSGTIRLDDNGSSPCEATLHWTLTRSDALVPRPQLMTEAPRYVVSFDVFAFSFDDRTMPVCSSSFALTIDPSKSRSVTGQGTCDGGTRFGEISGTFEVRGRYDDDQRIEGDIVFDMNGPLGTVQGPYPFTGRVSEDGQLVDFLFEGRATLDAREQIWFGTGEGEFLVPPAAG